MPLIKQIVVPIQFRDDVLREFHDNSNHNSVDKIYTSMRLKYFWPFLYRSIKTYVKLCTVCQASKHGHPLKAPLQPIEPQLYAWDRVHVDILGPLPVSNGHKYLLVCVDSLSRFVESFPMPSITAREVADILYSEIFARYSCRELCTDRVHI